jgi:hypothetical protein
VSTAGEVKPAGYAHQVAFAEEPGPQERAVAGLELAPHVGCFFTTGFDGALRVWDARTMRPGRPVLGEGQLSRCALVSADLIASGSMHGTVKLYDFNWARGLCV